MGLVGAGDYPDIDRAWTAAVGVEILTLFLFSISTEALGWDFMGILIGIYGNVIGTAIQISIRD